MCSRRERIEIRLVGGRPWGFSIKGGRESNKPLVISKMERGGKAESCGLFVGDILHSVNNVLLSGLRDEAIQLVKTSGHTLTLEVDRGMISKAATGKYHQPISQKTQYHNSDYYNPSPTPEQQYYDYDQEYPQSKMLPYEYDQPPESRNDDVFQVTPNSNYDDISKSSTSLNEGYMPSHRSHPNDVFLRDLRHVKATPAYHSSSSLDHNTETPVENQRHPAVKLRARKARDRGHPVERPRSWHASKHPDFDTSLQERNMRSPVTAYPGSPASHHRLFQPPLNQNRRRSKGWQESGDLKSTFKGDINGSKDSLISGGSQQSYRSGRLSVSSSRSSGTMSSSRGSLDNLVDNNYRYSGDMSSYPQITSSSKQKLSSPYKPQPGIVSQQKNIFEKLSQTSSASGESHQYSRGSREDLDRLSRVRRIPSDDSDREKPCQQLPYGRDSSKSPYHSTANSRRSSFSPPLVSVHLRNRSRDSDSDQSIFNKRESQQDNRTYEERIPSPSDVPPKRTSGTNLRFRDAKIIKTNLDTSRGRLPSSEVPEPPARDSSSAQAVRNYHIHSHLSSPQDESGANHPYASSPNDKILEHSSRAVKSSPVHQANTSIASTEAPHRITVTRPIEKNVETSKVSGRVFGVLSVGNSKDIVATSMTVSPKVKELDVNGEKTSSESQTYKDSQKKCDTTSPHRYEHLKDSYTAPERSGLNTDYVSRQQTRHSQPNIPTEHPAKRVLNKSVTEHTRTGSGDLNENLGSAKGKGRYGSVWKTPQVHRRGRSADFSTVLGDWAPHDKDDLAGRFSVFKPENNNTPRHLSDNCKEDVNSNTEGQSRTPDSASIFSNNKKMEMEIDNQPSILRSLQNAQYSDRQGKNHQSKANSDNYETLWGSEPNKGSKDANRDVPEERKAHYERSNKKDTRKSWTVELDDTQDDEAFGKAYCNDIKDMSRKVLRVTSFTRKELDVSPSSRTFEQKRKHFQFPAHLNQKQAHPAVIHSRSRSHGNEIDESSEPIAGTKNVRPKSGRASTDNSPSESARPRPKSAGVVRPSRHAPVHRTTVTPTYNSASYYTRKSESLPRNMIPSFHSDGFPSPTSKSPNKPLPDPSAQNRRVSVDVKPDFHQTMLKMSTDPAKKQAVLNFLSKKTGQSFDSGTMENYFTSSTSIHTSHSDETDKRRPKESTSSGDECDAVKHSSSGDLTCDKNLPTSESKSTPTTHKPDRHSVGSVRKLKNFKETRNKFLEGIGRLTSRTKSTSSLLEEESPDSQTDISRSSPLRKGERSASLENLTDSGLDLSRGSPAESRTDLQDLPQRNRSKSSPHIESLPSSELGSSADDVVRPPPRKFHRQRHSNSSNASSATTISTLSSFSSTSSTSVGKFPALGEESESSRKSPPTRQKTSMNSQYENVEAPQNSEAIPTRIPIDTGTYRVPKRKSTGKSSNIEPKSTQRSNAAVVHKSTVEIQVNSPKSNQDETDKKNTDTADFSKTNAPSRKETTDNINSSKLSVDPVNEECVKELLNQVKESKSYSTGEVIMMTSKNLPPPPPPTPLDGAAEQVLKEYVLQRSANELPLPPSIPAKPAESTLRDESQPTVNHHSADHGQVSEGAPPSPDTKKQKSPESGTGMDEQSSPSLSKRKSASYENAHLNGVTSNYENVFKPIKTESQLNDGVKNKLTQPETKPSKPAETKAPEKPLTSPPPEISPHPLLPDVSMLPDSSSRHHPNLSSDIIKGDKALAQVLTTTNQKRSADYMAGILSQPSHDIIEEGMRYRRNKPVKTETADNEAPTVHATRTGRPTPSEGLLSITIEPHIYLQRFRLDISSHESLPASSAYYKTSASKARILNLVKEKIADGELNDEEQDTLEEIIQKKMELVLSINTKLSELKNMKTLLDVEMRENECLGTQVMKLTKACCKPREQEKYVLFVQDVDKIINLLLSLSARLARAENAIQMHPVGADKQEMELLFDKRNKLMEQHKEAKLLKENIDRRQKAVSETLASYFDQEEFADYEHYIKMKSALIMEQRELDDKAKLGEEQMQCLRESLPEEWQIHLDKMLEEEEK
ncbi:uncharacterized protein LOC143473207 isoform X4 [Clavelina lepadiformis]|uniref:uncharacterized protein LOC143473207 isoform X4 n=1 Tax=Clavelina lepadiformis TaxID=159417 RepID=UPI0040425EAF